MIETRDAHPFPTVNPRDRDVSWVGRWMPIREPAFDDRMVQKTSIEDRDWLEDGPMIRWNVVARSGHDHHGVVQRRALHEGVSVIDTSGLPREMRNCERLISLPHSEDVERASRSPTAASSWREPILRHHLESQRR
jgi:hypothetical protein